MSMSQKGQASVPPPLPTQPISLRRQLIFWACALLVFIALLWLLNDVLLPFVAGMVLAYLLDPLVRRLQRLGLSRPIASVAIVVVMIVLLALALILILPVLGEQIAHFVERIPQYFERIRQIVQEQSQGWLGRMVGEKLPEAQKQLGGVASSAAGWVAGFLTSLWSGGKALIGVISLLVIAPIVAFYMLIDWENMIAKVDSWIPVQHRETVRGLAREMDGAISGFVRGQALVCLILGTFYSVALITLGVNFGLLIGITAAILGFAPYIGTLTGFLLAVGVATAQFWPDWTMPAMAAGIFLAGQFIEGNILQPLLVGKEIGLHPVWLMFALIAFGVLFGFVGLLVAVPVAAAIGVLVRFLLRQYLASTYYTGGA
jgi:predicted PurR-regulated permease PerM